MKAKLTSRRANEIALKGVIKKNSEFYHDLAEKYDALCKANKKLVDQFTKLLCTFSDLFNASPSNSNRPASKDSVFGKKNFDKTLKDHGFSLEKDENATDGDGVTLKFLDEEAATTAQTEEPKKEDSEEADA
ncbi:MAG: hypothetical protein IJU76_15370, partial [Desulfovibrionaceae bacterium]|nr:hypothetical protein [Desulfovibrionaceae bacterium]